MLKKITSIILLIGFNICTVLAVLPTPLLTSPADASLGNPANTTINWYSVSGANSYEFKIDTSSTLSNTLIQSSTSSQSLNTQLKYGTVFYWQVRALKTTGTPDSSDWTQIFSFSTSDTLTVSAPTNGSINQFPRCLLNWVTSGGISNYQVQLDEVNSFNSSTMLDSLVADSTSDMYTAQLKFGTTYYWRVRAMHTLDTMAWTSPSTFSTLDSVLLSAPLNGDSFQLTSPLLNWNYISGISNYQIQVDKSSSFNSAAFQTAVLPDSTSEWTPENLEFGATYYWRVRAWHAADTTQWSQTWSFTTLLALTLSAPLNNSTNQFPNVTLNWNYITPPIFYDIEYDTLSSFSSPALFYTTNDTVSEHKTAALFFGTKYYWRARMHNTIDTSQWSAIWDFTTLDSLTRSAPLKGELNIPSHTFLNWNAVEGTTGFDVRIDTVANFTSPISASFSPASSAQELFDLYFGTHYYWSVRAYHTADTTDWADNWDFTTSDAVSLELPANNSFDAPPRTLLDWTHLGGTSAYLVQYDTSANFSSPLLVTTNVATSSQNITGLYFNQKYFWRVKAINLVDTTNWSQTWNFTTINQLVHTAPLNGAMAQALVTEINWSGVSGAIGYIYRFDTSPLFNVVPQTGNSIGTNSRADINLPLYGQTYYWQVAVFNAVDTSAWSNPWSFTTLFQFLTPPILVTPSDGSTAIPTLNVTLNWNALPGAVGYEYAYSLIANFTPMVGVSTLDTFGVINGLSSFTTYYWRVRATNPNGYSAWSTAFAFTTLNPFTSAPILFAPEDLAIDVPQPATFSWYPLNFAASYVCEYDVDSLFSAPISLSVADTFAVSAALNPQVSYYWRVRGIDANALSAWSIIWSFTTENPLTVAPIQASPSDYSIGVSSPANFSWYPVSLASTYECEYAMDSLFTSPTTLLANDTAAISLPLNALTVYFWRVRGVLGNVTSPWSSTWRFTTLLDTVPTQVLPANLDTGLLTPVTFKWTTLSLSTNYECQYATDSLFSNPVILNSTSDSATSQALTAYTKYYWRVRATDGTQVFSWSPIWSFTTSVMVDFVSIEADLHLLMFPNPAHNVVTIQYANAKSEPLLLELYSINGSKIWSKKYAGRLNETIDLSTHAKGVYTLKVEIGNTIFRKKLILN